MLKINKISSSPVIDFAAEELKKYLRMMMPDCGSIPIAYAPEARDGFVLGLMQELSLDTSDAKDTVLDDIVYLDTAEDGGIISGDNPRAVLLAVYEYLRQNGCRFLFPGIDGELIPMQPVRPVKFRHMAFQRYRGYATEGGCNQTDLVSFIDYLPKLGMNVFMIEFPIPLSYYKHDYENPYNKENHRPEKLSAEQVLQWKRQLEAEIEKRGLQFHDMGHGFTSEPFGIRTAANVDKYTDEMIPEESLQFVAMRGGKRGLYLNSPLCTNFCMSNPKARTMVAEYVRKYVTEHQNVDYLHVWLADGSNNYCECEQCQKKLPADFYVMLLNEIDEKLTEIGSDARIAFISYVDTTWGPETEVIKNPARFTLLFAPIFRSYAYSIPEGRGKTQLLPYNRNKNTFPDTFAASLDYLDVWKKTWKGPCLAFEYHFWRHFIYDLTGLEMSRRVYDDVHIYKENGIDGIIEDASPRPFFPNGLVLYTYARSLYDGSLTYDEIVEDYYFHAYGEDWRLFRDYMQRILDALPYAFFSRDAARLRKNVHYDPAQAEKIASIREITKEGRALIEQHIDYPERARTVAVRLLLRHADLCDMVSDWMAAKARGELEKATELYNRARIEFGSTCADIHTYFDHYAFFGEAVHADATKSPGREDIVDI